MNRLRVASTLLAMAAGLAAASSAYAQARYNPTTPTTSPWMNMWQRNTGPLDNYHSFVAPQMQLNGTLRQQNMALQRQDANLQALGGEVNQLQQPVQQPTGAGGHFMDYSHFYPVYPTPGALSAPRSVQLARPARTARPTVTTRPF